MISMQSNKKKIALYGNGCGVGVAVWFTSSRKYVYKESDGIYVPVGDVRSSELNGGLYISKKGLNISCECVTFLSENKNEVQLFTEAAKEYCERIHEKHAIKWIRQALDFKIYRHKQMEADRKKRICNLKQELEFLSK